MPRRSLKKQAKEHKGEYVTRPHAIKYLQVSLNDFRRLCILKGIYPRDLQGRSKSHVQKGSTKQLTVYYRKDIQYLAHEPLLRKFREHKIFARKLTKALGRGDLADARRVDANRPRYTLDHIVKERYPTFLDAVGDMDDALSTLFLFAVMPATDKVSHRITEEAERLSTEWMAFVAREHLLRKVFVSIKGVYYQAVVRGQEVTWVVPFKFPQTIPTEVDFDIMLAFLEFYTTLVHFVLYKLYTDAGLVYPPPINSKREKGVGGLGTYLLESQSSSSLALPEIEATESDKARRPKVEISLDKARAADESARDGPEATRAANEDENDDNNDDESGEAGKLDEFKAEDNSGDLLAQPSAASNSGIFSKFTFFVGREVPLDIVEFVVLAFGGKLISEAALDELIDNEDVNASNDASQIKMNLDSVTHQICDRPKISQPVAGRVYIQPQWLFDSVNLGELQPVSAYAPGEQLPPHLSPWGDRGSYNPEEEDESDSDSDSDGDEAGAAADAAEEAENAEDNADEAEEDEDEDDEQRELKLEAQGVKFSEASSKKTKKRKTRKTEDEEKELRKTMMSNKERQLYEKVQGEADKKQARKETLAKKRKLLKSKN